MSRFRLRLIGPFGLFGADGLRIEISSKKSIALIALLAMASNGERARPWLQNMLWGSRDFEHGRASLRREISNLAKTLELAGAGALLTRNTQRVVLTLDMISVDVLDLGITETSGNRRAFEGQFLEGIDLRDSEEFEDWLREQRSRIEDMQALSLATEPSSDGISAREILGGDLPPIEDLLENRPPALPPKPSIAVLPFQQIGDEADQDWLGISLADELGVILSQFPQLFIVASISARELWSTGISAKEIAHRLGVRYVLQGILRRQGHRLRASVLLIEARTGEQIWGQNFDGEISDIFELQQQIALRIAPQVWSRVEINERISSLRTPRLSMSNYELYWRANALFRSWKRDEVLEAISLTDKMLELEPNCPWAASLAAYCNSTAYILNFAEDRQAVRRQAIMHCQTALRYGEDNVEALGYCIGTITQIQGDMAMADRLVAHALELLPSHAPTLFWSGWVDLANGRPSRARERFELNLRVNPATPVRAHVLCGIGYCNLFEGQFPEAYQFLVESMKPAQPFFLAPLGLFLSATMIGEEASAASAAQILALQDYSGFLSIVRDLGQRAMVENALAAAFDKLGIKPAS